MARLIRQTDGRTLAAFLLLGGVCVAAINWKWFSFSPDLSALYLAARFYALDLPELIYAAPQPFFDGTPPAWYPYLPALGLDQEIPLPYVYPPLWAVLFAPLAGAVPPQVFFQIVGTALILSLAAAVVVGWRLARSFAVPLWLWVMIVSVLLGSSLISFIALMHLQMQIFVVFLVLFSFERQHAGHSATAGAALALAAALKLAPAGFFLLFLIDRDRRAMASFAIVGAALGLASLAVAGIDLHFAFLDSLRATSSGLWVASVTISGDVIVQALASLAGLTPPIDFTARNIWISHDVSALGLVNKALLVVGIFWMLRRTAALTGDKRIVVRLFTLSLLFNLFGPLGWVHYYLLQLMLLPALLTLFPGRQGIALLGAFGVLTSWPMFLGLRTQIAGDMPAVILIASAMVALFVIVCRGPARAKPQTSATVPAE